MVQKDTPARKEEKSEVSGIGPQVEIFPLGKENYGRKIGPKGGK